MTWREATADWPAATEEDGLRRGRRRVSFPCGATVTLVWAADAEASLIADGAAEVEYVARHDGGTAEFAGLLVSAGSDEARLRLAERVSERLRR